MLHVQLCPIPRPHGLEPAMGFYQQEYWSGLLFPSPGDLANSGMEHRPSASPILQADALLLNHQGSYLEKVILDL